MKTGMKKTAMNRTLGLGAAGLFSLLAVATTAEAQEYDDTGWWEAEELFVDQPRFKDSPQPAVIALSAYSDRNGRDRGKNGRDTYNRRGDDGDRDRYDDRNRVRGRQGGIVIPGGRVRVQRRPNLRGRSARGGYYNRPQWRRANWDVRFRHIDRYDRGRRRSSLRDIVGRRTVRRLQEHRNWLGARGNLNYRWVSIGYRGEVLQVRAGRRPIAEFVDFGSDYRVDIVRLAR